jgi:peroxiredoxin
MFGRLDGMVAVPSQMLPLGTTAPEFQVPAPDGTLHGPSDVADARALLVAFVCNHCPFVVHIGPKLGELTSRWADQGVATIGVMSNDLASHPEDGPEHMVGFAEKNGWQFPYVTDETQAVAKTYRAACTPDLFLFGGDRKLIYRGQLDDSRPSNGLPVTGDDLDAAIKAELAGEPVTEDQKPSIGCNIKWKPGNEPEYFPA